MSIRSFLKLCLISSSKFPRWEEDHKEQRKNGERERINGHGEYLGNEVNPSAKKSILDVTRQRVSFLPYVGDHKHQCWPNGYRSEDVVEGQSVVNVFLFRQWAVMGWTYVPEDGAVYERHDGARNENGEPSLQVWREGEHQWSTTKTQMNAQNGILI